MSEVKKPQSAHHIRTNLGETYAVVIGLFLVIIVIVATRGRKWGDVKGGHYKTGKCLYSLNGNFKATFRQEVTPQQKT